MRTEIQYSPAFAAAKVTLEQGKSVKAEAGAMLSPSSCSRAPTSRSPSRSKDASNPVHTEDAIASYTENRTVPLEDPAHAASRVRDIAGVARNDVGMRVSNGLAGYHSDVDADDVGVAGESDGDEDARDPNPATTTRAVPVMAARYPCQPMGPPHPPTRPTVPRHEPPL